MVTADISNAEQRCYRLTESQTGRGWKGPLEVILSNPPAQAGPPRAAAQASVQVGFEYLQGWRLTNLPGQPVTLTAEK